MLNSELLSFIHILTTTVDCGMCTQSQSHSEEAGSTEEAALVEATLQCKAALGNLGGVDVGCAGDPALESQNVPAFHVGMPAMLAFVSAQQFFVGHCHPPASLLRANSHTALVAEHALDAWKKEATLSVSVLSDAHDARLNTHTLLGQNRHLALVSMSVPELDGRAIRFVHWQSIGSTGRPIALDSHGRIKALVCVGALREAMNLSDAYIIHPNVGVGMVRSRGYRCSERPEMPAGQIRLHTICEHALISSTCSEDAHVVDILDSSCGLCQFRQPSGPFPTSLGGGDLTRCPLCLQCLG